MGFSGPMFCLQKKVWASFPEKFLERKSAMSFSFVPILETTGRKLNLQTQNRNSLRNLCISESFGFMYVITSHTESLSQKIWQVFPAHWSPQSFTEMIKHINSLMWIGIFGSCNSIGNFLLIYSCRSGFQEPMPIGQASPAIWTETKLGTMSSTPLNTSK